MDHASTDELFLASITREVDGEAFLVIPALREEAHVRKQIVTTGVVRIRKIVHEREESIEEPCVRTRIEIERVPVNQAVDMPPPVRREGNTTVYSVVEEVLVVTKRYVLKEEVRVTHHVSEAPGAQRISLRAEELIVEREEIEAQL